MVYCNLVSHTKDKALYKYGGYDNDLTGLLEFDIKNNSFEIIKEPDESYTFIRHIRSLWNKYYKDFKQGIFRDKLSYEN